MQPKSTTEEPYVSIDETILAAIFAHRVRPGSRLGEADVAALFGVSRTLVREAMIRLQSRRIVDVRPRRGWFVAEPSVEEARQVFQARRIFEAGVMSSLPHPLAPGRLAAVRAHLDQEAQAIAAGDRPRLICLMGDFHIRLVELLDNPVLVGITRDLTARTILISTLYQSQEHATQSHDGHVLIVEAIEAGDRDRAAALAVRHLDEVEAGLRLDLRKDPLDDLRRSLDLPLDLAPPANGGPPAAKNAPTATFTT